MRHAIQLREKQKYNLTVSCICVIIAENVDNNQLSDEKGMANEPAGKEVAATKPPEEQNREMKNERGPCESAFQNAIATGDSNLPYCDEDGFYVTKQCSGSMYVIH